MSLQAYNKNRKERNKFHRENRELVFTTPDMIRTLLTALLNDFSYLKDMQWHDIAAADGRWEKILREEYGIKNCRSSDIFPLNDAVEKLDLFSIIPDPNIFYFGNLPFSKAKPIYYKFRNCHRYFLGGLWMNKLGGRNYNVELKPSCYPKHFEFIDGSTHSIMFSANYSTPYEPMPINKIISGYEYGELTKNEKNKYLFISFKLRLLKDNRHEILKFYGDTA